jgi:hypothetical protein
MRINKKRNIIFRLVSFKEEKPRNVGLLLQVHALIPDLLVYFSKIATASQHTEFKYSS